MPSPTSETRQRIQEMRRRMTVAEMAAALGITRQAVEKHLRKMGAKARAAR